MLQTFSSYQWNEPYSNFALEQAIYHLENGHILYFPHLPFTLHADENYLLSPEYADPKAKNISFLSDRNKLWGVQRLNDQQHQQMKAMMLRFSTQATTLVNMLLPRYTTHLIHGRTSFRPVEVGNRKTSYRKDDKRLHVDAFPSAPNQGKRILRVFSNVNPTDDRVWRVGEPFADVANRFLPHISGPLLGSRSLLRFLKVTKSYRSLYDHYMLHLHDAMKANEQYQQNAPQQTVRFPSNSTWIVQTDHVSHAAMAGQYVFEQTFYLPVNAMQDPNCSPLRVLEKMLEKKLV